MVKSSAKPEKDGSPSQNPSNVSKTKFPVINKFLINSIAKFTISVFITVFDEIITNASSS